MMRFVVVCLFVFVLGCAKKEPAKSVNVSKAGLSTLNGVDMIGGDIKRFVATKGLSQCADACAANKKCNAFTYAHPSHKDVKKHKSCWLKKTGFKYTRSAHYTSGVKP